MILDPGNKYMNSVLIGNNKISNTEGQSEKQSRGERRTLKALEIFCFKKVDKVDKVKIEKKKQIWLVSSPELFQSQDYRSLLIFGDAKVGKGSSL